VTTTMWPLRRAAAVAPDRIAVRCGADALTYADTRERCRRLVAGLRGLGVGPGDRVAIVSANCHRYLEVYQAVPGAGMVVVPLNQRHTDAELAYALEDGGVRVLFSSRQLGELPPCVEHVVDLGDGYESLLDGAPDAEAPAEPGPDDIAGLFYTGGTTGASKGVMLTHRNLVANAFHMQACWRFDADTRWLVVAPMFHAAGTIAVLATTWHAG
jgi:long-chain acyl-CoA synthetase